MTINLSYEVDLRDGIFSTEQGLYFTAQRVDYKLPIAALPIAQGDTVTVTVDFLGDQRIELFDYPPVNMIPPGDAGAPHLGALLSQLPIQSLGNTLYGPFSVTLLNPTGDLLTALYSGSIGSAQSIFPLGAIDAQSSTSFQFGGFQATATSPRSLNANEFLFHVHGYNVNLINAVPIPPAAWLFGSALGLMGVMRRKLSS